MVVGSLLVKRKNGQRETDVFLKQHSLFNFVSHSPLCTASIPNKTNQKIAGKIEVNVKGSPEADLTN